MSAWLDELTPEGLHVWRIWLTQPDDVVRTLESHLSVEEAGRANRYRREQDRIRYVVAHGALRELLASYTTQAPRDISYGRTATKKPYLVDGRGERPVRFNLSHSGEWAVVGIALAAEVGIDIERIDPEVSVEAVVDRFFSRSEFEAFRAVSRHERSAVFFTSWARKEAYVKARGDGIAGRLPSFSVSIDPKLPPTLLRDSMDASAVGQWMIYDLDIASGYVAAVAAEGRAHQIRAMKWAHSV